RAGAARRVLRIRRRERRARRARGVGPGSRVAVARGRRPSRHGLRSRARDLGAIVAGHPARGRDGGRAPSPAALRRRDRDRTARTLSATLVRYCPECGGAYEDAVVACPQCREVLVTVLPDSPHAREPEAIHRVPDAAAGALLCGMLEHHGIPAVLRSATLPGY